MVVALIHRMLAVGALDVGHVAKIRTVLPGHAQPVADIAVAGR